MDSGEQTGVDDINSQFRHFPCTSLTPELTSIWFNNGSYRLIPATGVRGPLWRAVPLQTLAKLVQLEVGADSRTWISSLPHVCHMCSAQTYSHLNANVWCSLAKVRQAARRREHRYRALTPSSWHLSPSETETCTWLACWRSFCRALAALLLFFMHKRTDSGPAARKEEQREMVCRTIP